MTAKFGSDAFNLSTFTASCCVNCPRGFMQRMDATIGRTFGISVMQEARGVGPVPAPPRREYSATSSKDAEMAEAAGVSLLLNLDQQFAAIRAARIPKPREEILEADGIARLGSISLCSGKMSNVTHLAAVGQRQPSPVSSTILLRFKPARCNALTRRTAPGACRVAGVPVKRSAWPGNPFRKYGNRLSVRAWPFSRAASRPKIRARSPSLRVPHHERRHIAVGPRRICQPLVHVYT